MNREALMTLLEASPIVAAVKDEEGLSALNRSDCKIVFILFGNILNISSIVEEVKRGGRAAFVHIDLIDGLSSRDVAVDFIAERTRADGIISTKMPVIRYAKTRELATVQRFFLLDSMALSAIARQIGQSMPDMIEVLPGCLPKIIQKICQSTDTPLIAGGLIQDKEDIIAALEAGATGISATRSEIWNM